jgi:hypothetical protein
MKYTVLLLLMACIEGPGTSIRLVPGPPERMQPCSISQTDDGVLIQCTDGTQALVKNGEDGETGAVGATGAQGAAGSNGTNGTNGLNGSNGVNGSNGHSIVYSTLAATSCSNGGQTVMLAVDSNDNLSLDIDDTNIQSVTICNGNDGAQGATGQAGTNGTNGSNGSNGTNGTNGLNAPPTPFTPVGLINPCGDANGIYDEIFLKLSNGTLLASFSDNTAGNNTRFSVLVPGTYSTTDNDHCIFTVDSNNNIVNENHHY